MLKFLARVRPSNLIILFALPFIVWLFSASPQYTRSLAAILGIEPGSAVLVPGFALIALAAFASLIALIWRHRLRRPIWWLLAICAGLAGAALAFTDLGLPFVRSVVANAVDPFTSSWIVRGETPRRLTDIMAQSVDRISRAGFMTYLVVSLGGLVAMSLVRFRPLQTAARRGMIVVNAVIALTITVFVHVGFAAGVAISIRAAILAYMLAVLLGLGWVGMLQLTMTRRTHWWGGALAIVFTLMAVWQFLQPHHAYVLVGNISGRIAVTQGTPGALIDSVRLGVFPNGPGTDLPVRTYASTEAALAALLDTKQVTAALLPAAAQPQDFAELWATTTISDGARTAGAAFSVLAIVTALLTIGGLVHRRHSLSVGAEFIIDTIRGIPMLVIILYIGLPLAGAVKDASGGFVDPPNLVRGIVAMAVAYSAYLAEIFRAGINAIPHGQVEAAHALGLSRWATARHIILPQAFRIVVPPLGNEFIAILKDTSLLSILSIRDITQRMREFQSASFLPFAPYNSAAIFYVLLTLAAASLVASIERRFHVKR